MLEDRGLVRKLRAMLYELCPENGDRLGFTADSEVSRLAAEMRAQPESDEFGALAGGKDISTLEHVVLLAIAVLFVAAVVFGLEYLL